MILTKRLTLLFFVFLTIIPLSNILAKDVKDIEEGGDNIFANQALLNPVFEKLEKLEKDKKGKINIVHIGDSHVQADFFTNTIREALQSRFGNGGFGFTFPYSLIKTNGPRVVKYACNTNWQRQMNVSPIADVGVGLSGIALYTPTDDFVLQLYTTEGYEFNKVKVIYPTKEPQYRMSITAEPLQATASGGYTAGAIGLRTHKIKNGESLSTIAKKYGVTITQIKKANNLKSDKIRAKQNLKIPVKGQSTSISSTKATKSNIEKDSIDYVRLETKPYCSSYSSDTLMDRITILPAQKSPMYNFNGFVIENNRAGVIYHAIGVNGAKMSDYNKYPLFFEQLPILEPDLIILSFGTNESFGKMSDSEYLFQLNEFEDNIRKLNKNAVILVMTPPPSMFRRQRANTYITNYSIALMGLSNTPVWDLYTRMGGASGIATKGQYACMIARDKVHYTIDGYKAQGELFVSDFIDAYTNYKRHKVQ